MSRRQVLGLAAMAAAAVPLASGCSGDADSVEPLKAPPENEMYPLAEAKELFHSLAWPKTDVPEPTKPVTVTMAITADKNAEVRHQQFAYFFREQHPNIQIKREVTSFDDFLTKYLTAAAGGSLSDVMYCQYAWAANLIKKNILAPLDDFIAKTPDFKVDDFAPEAISYWIKDGKHYAVPSDSAPKLLFYNKDIFDKAGVKYPDATWTWQKLQETAVELTSGSGVNKIFGYTPMPKMSADLAATHLLAYGGRFLNPDESAVTINEPGAHDALAPWVELAVKHKAVPSNAEMQALAAADPFRRNHAAMSVNGLWILSQMQTLPKADRFRWGLTDIPSGPQGRFSPLVGSSFGITKRAKHPEAAWIVLNAFMSAAGHRYFRVTPPSRLSTFEQNLADLKLPAQVVKDGKAAVKTYGTSDGVLRGPATTKITDTATVTWDKVRAGTMSLADGLAEIQSTVGPILKENA
ncbi:ABC transporter substrate-binding protein [Kribbella sp. C-35]|uniref:ABC transporter substrate-binding protein n=1 Tax=Kribbella sp. C-35 TaxID=2789276 RepID=UPI00397DF52A